MGISRFMKGRTTVLPITSLYDEEVVGVVGRRDLERAGAELHVHILVGDDGDLAVHEGQDHGLADHVLVARVIGVHGHGRVAEHGLGPGGGDGDAALPFRVGIRDPPQAALHGAVLHLVVGQRGAVEGAPVHHVLTAVDEALLVEAGEDLEHRVRQSLVHGEPLAAPIEGRAEPAKLLVDDGEVLLLHLPDPIDELLAAQFVAVRALGVEHALDHALGRDAGVVGAGLPQRVVALHPPPAGEDVLERVVQHVPQGQDAGHVGRRDDDGVRLALGVHVGLEVAAFFPRGVPSLFHGGRVVAGREIGFHVGAPGAVALVGEVRGVTRRPRPRGARRPRSRGRRRRRRGGRTRSWGSSGSCPVPPSG
jgi:hypothetical protein